MGSVGIGLLASATYGIWAGVVTFVILALLGLFLHKVADRLERDKS